MACWSKQDDGVKDLGILPRFAKVWSTWTFWDMKCREKISRFQSFGLKIDESNEVSGRRGWVLVITLAGVTNLGERVFDDGKCHRNAYPIVHFLVKAASSLLSLFFNKPLRNWVDVLNP